MTNESKLPLFPILLVAAILLIGGAFFTMGGIVYTGSTIPAGLYLREDKPLAIGKLVTFCPPDLPVFHEAKQNGLVGGGSCPNGFECLMLTVAAKRKDVVTINEDGVKVNDRVLANSKPLIKDKEGRVMRTFMLDHYELKENEVLLTSDSGNDPFDGRYFGVIDVAQVDSVIKPLF
ncbi:MAG: conjugative transfer signal peptidase TraF [Gammaproteobacteria bacterium]|nr:conjugative transfer signal peptidase TraF [Gammaproteobacteria bacterium]